VKDKEKNDEVTLKRIIYDGDPGIDDALAILLALRSEKLKLERITTVCGNVPVDMATNNALKVLHIAGRKDIKVSKGAERPLRREPKHAIEFHGEDGLGNTNLPTPDIEPEPTHAVDVIISQIMERRWETTLVTAGPLTNLAVAIEKETSIKDYVKEVIIMGGAITAPGNVTPAAEYNIHCDPHAAEKVFQSGLPITLVPLDVTTKNILTLDRLAQIESTDTELTTFIGKISRFYMKASKKYENLDGCYLHDPLAVAVAIDRSLVKTRMMHVMVETNETVALGKTIADLRAITRCAPNIEVCVDVESQRFIDLFVETLKR